MVLPIRGVDPGMSWLEIAGLKPCLSPEGAVCALLYVLRQCVGPNGRRGGFSFVCGAKLVLSEPCWRKLSPTAERVCKYSLTAREQSPGTQNKTLWIEPKSLGGGHYDCGSFEKSVLYHIHTYTYLGAFSAPSPGDLFVEPTVKVAIWVCSSRIQVRAIFC